MRRCVWIVMLLGIVSVGLTGCKKKKDDSTAALQELVEKINATPDQKLQNGTVLQKCEYKQGDSLFTYYIKVEDQRFDEISTDSIKSNLLTDLKSDNMKKVLMILKKNSIGLQYKYNTDKKEIDIILSPKELLLDNE